MFNEYHDDRIRIWRHLPVVLVKEFVFYPFCNGGHIDIFTFTYDLLYSAHH